MSKAPLIGWLLSVLVLSVLVLTSCVPVAQAAPLCRAVENHQVCILKITRSAKYYWEYRAIVKINDQQRPMGRYNCRTQDYVGRNGNHHPRDIGTQVICSFFKQ